MKSEKRNNFYISLFAFICTNGLFHLCAHLGFAQHYFIISLFAFIRTNCLFLLCAHLGFAQRFFRFSLFAFRFYLLPPPRLPPPPPPPMGRAVPPPPPEFRWKLPAFWLSCCDRSRFWLCLSIEDWSNPPLPPPEGRPAGCCVG